MEHAYIRLGEELPSNSGYYFVIWEPGDVEVLVYLKSIPGEDSTDINSWLWGKSEQDDPEAVTLDIKYPENIRWRLPT